MRDNTRISFTLSSPEEMVALAQLTAEWVKCEVTFVMEKCGEAISVQLTGGY